MKILRGEVENFGSYNNLEFDFSQQGLALIFGKTGSGKSTIPDMVSWVLFGETAKNGSIDDVRNWTNLEVPTKGTLEVETYDGVRIVVTRERGGKRNDLLWSESNVHADPIRGKDLIDTQRLLEARLGVDSYLYFGAASFHEFCPTGLFFLSKAKDRRAVFERIANLELATKLSAHCGDSLRKSNRNSDSILRDASTLYAHIDISTNLLARALSSSSEWIQDRETTIKEFKTKGETFEKTKLEKIQAIQLRKERWDLDNLTKKNEAEKKIQKIAESIEDPNLILKRIENQKKLGSCVICGQPLKEYQAKIDALNAKLAENDRLLDKVEAIGHQQAELYQTPNPFLLALKSAKEEINSYEEHIKDEERRINPFTAQIAQLEADIKEQEEESAKLEAEQKELDTNISNLEQLQDLTAQLRVELLTQSVRNVQDSTNRYLEKYFDSEIRIEFALEGIDDLKVNIQKSGYDCVFKQLSRGQRSLLRLCFVVSMMKAAANNAGIHFGTLFFDEVLDGLDGDLKIKAFGLLEELSTEHESVFVIDHAQEFQNLFSKRYQVTMESDISHIEELE